MTKPTELRTERLLLRPFRLSDTDDVLRYASDAEWAAEQGGDGFLLGEKCVA